MGLISPHLGPLNPFSLALGAYKKIKNAAASPAVPSTPTGIQTSTPSNVAVSAPAMPSITPPATQASTATINARTGGVVKPVSTTTPVVPSVASTTKKATLWGPNNEARVVDIGSQDASILQSQGWGLNKGGFRAPAGAAGGSVAPAQPAVPNIPAPTKPATPEATPYDIASKEYSEALKVTPEEEAAQRAMDELNTSLREKTTAIGEQAIPLEFIVGQQRTVEDVAQNRMQTLEQRAARLQAKRVANLDASKFKLEAEKEKIAQQKAEEKPIALSVGESLVNPKTGKTVATGGSVVDRQAQDTFFNLTQSFPDTNIAWDDKLNAQQNLSKLQAAIAVSPTFKQKMQDASQNPNRVLSATEAQALGVPFGTTAGMAYGLTPQKPLTEAQSKDLTYGTRGDESNVTINEMEDTIAKYNPLSWTAYTAAENTTLGNTIVPDEIKQIRQAERNFGTAVLRRESGATILPSEFATLEKQYFPRPGDDAKTLKQKAQNRKTAIESFKKAAGPAAFPQGGQGGGEGGFAESWE